jgi:hypothetical protein
MEYPEKPYITSLKKSIKSIKVADHIIYITYPIIKEKRLILKALESTYDAAVSVLNAILQYEHAWKRISLSQNAHENFQTFVIKCTKNYNITEQETRELKELILTVENHKRSALEFLRKERIIIMEDSLRTHILDAEKVKSYLKTVKVIFQKARNVIGLE